MENDPVGIHPVTHQSNWPSLSQTCSPPVFPEPSTQIQSQCDYHLTSAINHSPSPADSTSLAPRPCQGGGHVSAQVSPGASSPPSLITTPLAQGGSFSHPRASKDFSFPLKSLTVDGGRALTSQVGMCF